VSLGDILAKLSEENRCNAYPDPLGLRVRRRPGWTEVHGLSIGEVHVADGTLSKEVLKEMMTPLPFPEKPCTEESS